jgi:peptide chain release factor 2
MTSIDEHIAKLCYMENEINRIHEESNIVKKIHELERLINSGKANPEIFKDYGILEHRKKRYEELRYQTDFAVEYLKDAKNTSKGSLEEAISTAKGVIKQIHDYLLEHRFTGKYDQNNAFVSLQNGFGDHNSNIKRLAETYTEFSKRKGFVVEVINFSESNITLRVEGTNAYAYLKGEHGVHKFISYVNNKKQTGNVTVIVEPEIYNPKIVVNDKDIKKEYFSASTKGGQNANKSETCVKLTHKPSKISAIARKRSQIDSYSSAMKVLVSRVDEFYNRKNNKVGEDRMEPGRGGYSRIYDFTRNYIKDARNGYIANDTGSFFGGKIDSFVYAFYGLRSLI